MSTVQCILCNNQFLLQADGCSGRILVRMLIIAYCTCTGNRYLVYVLTRWKCLQNLTDARQISGITGVAIDYSPRYITLERQFSEVGFIILRNFNAHV